MSEDDASERGLLRRDLREQLDIIIGSGEQLAASALDEKQQQLLQTITSASHRVRSQLEVLLAEYNTEVSATQTHLPSVPPQLKILVLDDESAIHHYFDIVFEENDWEEELEWLLGKSEQGKLPRYHFDYAPGGEQGVEMMHAALQDNAPYLVAYVDMRMVPGMSGLQAAKALRAIDPRLYIVIMTAYSDHSLEEINQELEHGVLFLKKPFSREELKQTTHMLTRSWLREHVTGFGKS